MGGPMAAFEVIDIRSFSNLWFWMVLAVMWSSASHRVIGIPYDMIQNAKRHGGQAERDHVSVARDDHVLCRHAVGSSVMRLALCARNKRRG